MQTNKETREKRKRTHKNIYMGYKVWNSKWETKWNQFGELTISGQRGNWPFQMYIISFRFHFTQKIL